VNWIEGSGRRQRLKILMVSHVEIWAQYQQFDKVLGATLSTDIPQLLLTDGTVTATVFIYVPVHLFIPSV